MKGNLRKLKTDLQAQVQYQLPVGDELLDLNPLIGKTLTLRYTGKINCIACGAKTKKSFNQGHCYPCFIKIPQCDMCILKPELCHYDKGTCRDSSWGESNCMIPHYVYLANTSGLKVGITRHTQIPTRWMDQGATQALPIARVAKRYHAGLLEILIKQHMSDKTNWRALLKGDAEPMDLAARRDQLFAETASEIAALQAEHDGIELLSDNDVLSLDYPVEQFATKIISHNFDKNPEVTGVLQGIKGQYLLLDTGVINIRKFGGYEVEVDAAS